MRDPNGCVAASTASPSSGAAAASTDRTPGHNAAAARTLTDAVDAAFDVASDLLLRQNYPNPFNPQTTIAFSVPEAGPVRLLIYDVTGRSVRTLVDGRLTAGPHAVPWDGRDDLRRPVSSGVYYCRLECGAGTVTRKMVLLK